MDQPNVDPSRRRRIIERPRLLRLLDETEARIILLVAPAGYGKTTLARQWLARSGRPAAWYRASAGSTDPAALAAALADAVGNILPTSAARLQSRLRSANAPAPQPTELARLLADDIRGWPPTSWFAIDDHHVLTGSAGEEFLGELVSASSVRTLVTSRNRPNWVTARMLVYGEVFELGRADLAFTSGEADDALAGRAKSEAAEIYERSEGWPAIIGLAALTNETAPAAMVPPNVVHDFFADEVFSRLPEETQDDLLAVCPAPAATTALLRHLFGIRASETLARGVEAGFLSVNDSTNVEMHPLLRAFLLRKLGEVEPVRHRACAMRIALFLLQTHDWDQAAAIVMAFQLSDLWEVLINGALEEYLSIGRLATLSEWLDCAARAGVDLPILDVARSEVAFRRGSYAASERAALRALERVDRRNARISRAWFRAGQAAHFQDDPEAAAMHYEEALASAGSNNESREALWGLFNLAAEIESDRALAYLSAFEGAGPLDQTSRLRVAGARLALAIRAGGLGEPLEEALRVRPIVPSVTDPVARSGFLNALTHGLVVAARYREAGDVVSEELADARDHGLYFVLPHALLLNAAANVGLRRFAAASRQIRSLRVDPADAHVSINRAILQAKLALATGKGEQAYRCVSRDWTHPPSSAMQGELLAIRALVRACVRDSNSGFELAERARAITTAVEAVSLADWATAIANFDETGDPESLLSALDSVSARGIMDSFVVAYRGRPSILAGILDLDPSRWATVQGVLHEANDLELAPPQGQATALSRREADVYELLGRSYSNREIAETLFISEATVKVHVRRILKKLNVRSRTEAAVRHARSRDGD